MGEPGPPGSRNGAVEVFRVALLLGLTSFGGPIAHLGYFQRQYVVRLRWLTEATYLDLVAISQFLPGPASSQVGIAIGLLRAGYRGAVAAWLGFTLPSAVALTVFALLTTRVDVSAAGWLHGLKLAAVAIVAAAVLSMWRSLAPDLPRRAIALGVTAVILLGSTVAPIPVVAVQVLVIVGGAALGWWLLSYLPAPDVVDAPSPVGQRAGLVALTCFTVLLVGLPVAAELTRSSAIAVVDAFYRAGSLVFGGGHVVLPLLDASVVGPGWVSGEQFIAGYGAAQAVPGPLFTFAAFLGASLRNEPTGIVGALLATLAVFLPSFFLVIGVIPFWDRLRRSVAFRGALGGMSAAVIGLLLAALYDPIWTSAVGSVLDVVLVVVAFGALVVRNAPSWAVVLGLAVSAQIVHAVGWS